MTTVDPLSRFNEYVQASFRNGMATVEKLHQSAVEIPIDMATELGFAREKADFIKDMHRRMLKDVYGAVCGAHEDIGALVVQQVGELRTLANDLGATRGSDKKTADGARRQRRDDTQSPRGGGKPAKTS